MSAIVRPGRQQPGSASQRGRITPAQDGERGGTLPVRGDLDTWHAASLAVAALVAVVGVAGLLLGSMGLYGNPVGALGPTPSTAGVLIPGWLGHDAFSLFVALPLLFGTVWLARRGSLAGLLLWPGALGYLLYSYVIYAIGAPFSGLFLLDVVLVALTGLTTIGVVAAIDRAEARERLVGSVPARPLACLLVLLALLTLGQDGAGVIATAAGGAAPADPAARAVWAADLTLEVPLMLLGGVLLWRRAALGYVAGAGLLLQYGLTPVALAFGLALKAVVAGSEVDWGTVAGVLVFAAVCFTSLAFFIRGATKPWRAPQPGLDRGTGPRWPARPG